MHARKLITIFLVLVLTAGLFAGCAKEGTTNGGSAGDSTGTNAGFEQTFTAEGFGLPIVADKASFDIWCGYAPSAGQQAVDVGDVLAYKVAEERTNIHINFTTAAGDAIQEQFNLSIMSGDYYDSYQTISQLWSSGFDFYVENEVILDLNPYMQYLPNYDRVRRMDAATFPTTITDSGYAPGIFMIAKTMQWAVLGPLVRGDFLNKWGLSNPETFDELHNVLSTFKQNGVETPLVCQPTGLEDWLMVGYDTMYTSGHGGAQFLVDDNGKVDFSILRQGTYEYLEMMNQWYNEGLLDKDFYSVENGFGFFGYSQGCLQRDEGGLLRTLYSGNDMIKFGAENPDFQLIGLYIPTKNKGEQIHISFGAAPITFNKDTISVITTSCENVETFCRWHDYFWTEEGSLLGNYGVEGESFNYDTSGKPMFNEHIYANEDGISMLTVMFDYAFQPYQGYWYDWEREFSPLTSEETMGTKDAWGRNVDAKHNLPAVTLSAEESSEASAILGDCFTYIDEMIVRFIIGAEPLSNWDKFETNLKNLKVDRAVEIYQAAYDRYAAR